jgi:hypothetical protein
MGPDPQYGARLKYLPSQSSSKTLDELLASQGIQLPERISLL